jgi:hypothetical protein
LNQWTKTRDAWLEPGLWESLREEDATIPDGADVYVGVDVGLIHDSTAVVLAHKRADGRIVVKARVWTAREGDPGELVPGGRVQLEGVEQHIAGAREALPGAGRSRMTRAFLNARRRR